MWNTETRDWQLNTYLKDCSQWKDSRRNYDPWYGNKDGLVRNKCKVGETNEVPEREMTV